MAIIIGVAGGTGSGKTTVVNKIVASLPKDYVAVVPLDSYYNDTSGMTEQGVCQNSFDRFYTSLPSSDVTC